MSAPTNPTPPSLQRLLCADRRDGRGPRAAALMPFLTAGYPDLETTGRLLDAIADLGVEVVELGFPFSDPIADGPVIAESMHEAIARGTTPADVLAFVRALRKAARPASRLAIVAMVSVSIVQRFGVEAFAASLASSGFVGAILPDADLHDAEPWSAACERHGLASIHLVAPTTGEDRLRRILAHCRGFVYLLARAGVTGESHARPELAEQATRIRTIAPDIPIVAGFGISTPEQVDSALGDVDGVIVGSGIVRRMGAALAEGRDPVPDIVRYIQSLASR